MIRSTGLTGKGSAAWDYLISEVKSGSSWNQMQHNIAERGLGYRASELAHDWQKARTAVGRWDTMESFERDELIPGRLYTKTDQTLQKGFYTTFRANMRDISIGKTYDRYITVQHDLGATRGELQDIAESMLDTAAYGDRLRAEVEVVSGYRA